jgi:hypothetical protein
MATEKKNAFLVELADSEGSLMPPAALCSQKYCFLHDI